MTREILLVVSLWLSVILMGIWVGGTLYQMLVIVPLWTASLPESLRSFVQGTDFGHTILRFFGPTFMPIRLAPILVALIAGWSMPGHRTPLLIALGCYLFIVAFSVLYIYPINATIMAVTGTTEEIRSTLTRWIFADRLRFAVGCVGFLALLWAFRLPIPTSR